MKTTNKKKILNKDKKEQKADCEILVKEWGLNDFAVCLR